LEEEKNLQKWGDIGLKSTDIGDPGFAITEHTTYTKTGSDHVQEKTKTRAKHHCLPAGWQRHEKPSGGVR
jgi:hypothetical protein